MNNELSPLEDWILENASEDDNLIWQTVAVADRLSKHGSLADPRKAAFGAILRLVEHGLIEVGEAHGQSIHLPKGVEAEAFLADPATWRPQDSELPLDRVYGATERGITLNESFEASGAPRTARAFPWGE